MPYCAIHGAQLVPDCQDCLDAGYAMDDSDFAVSSASLTPASDSIACPGCDFTVKTPLALGAHVKKAHKGMKLTSSKSDEGVKTYALTPA